MSPGDGAKYSLFSYSTVNLGDEIQSIAARQFLPSVDLLIDRDRPNVMPSGAAGRYKLILNGWHSCHPENWPPAPQIVPLPVAMHFTNEISGLNPGGHRPSELLVEGDNLAYLRDIAPIGTRDLWTLKLLRDKGVDAYFSGCLTLTLGPGTDRHRQDYICAVDLRPHAERALKERHAGPIVVTTHIDRSELPFEARMRKAEDLLSLYAQARCVVTSRLHCALPCLALGTPVLFVISAKDTYRFEGLKELLHSCTLEEFLKGQYSFDLNAPPENSDLYREYRDRLIKKAADFSGTFVPFKPSLR